MSRSIGDAGTTDLMNLLHTDSDSDAVELLNLPPLKKANTKPKKRKNNRGISNELCSLWNLSKIVLVLTLIGVVALTGAVTYRLTNQMKDLQNKIKKMEVESSNLDIPTQWQTIKSQVQDFNKSLTSFRTGEKGLDEVIKNLTKVDLLVQGLQDELNKMKTGLGKNPAQPATDINSLSEIVARLGSDVLTLKTTQGDFEKKQFNKLVERVQQLEEKSSLISMGVNPSAAPAAGTGEERAVVRQELDSLHQSAEAINSSLSARLDQIDLELAAHQSHFDALESAASKPHVSINTSMITETVRGQLKPYIQALVKNSSHSIAPTFDSSILDAIKSQVKNISTTVLDLQEQVISNPGEDTPGLQALQSKINTIDSSLESLDKKASKVQNETDQLMELYVQEKNSIVKLANIVDGIRRYVDTSNKPKDEAVGSTPQTSLSTTEAPAVPMSTPSENSGTTTRTKREAEADLNKELEDLFQ